MSLFQPATRTAVKLKLGIAGPSGAGKTYSALRLAMGLTNNGKVALIDTENASASLYADKFGFCTANMTAPFIVPKFIKAIDEAVAAGFDCLIIDSISTEWQELLQEKERLDTNPKANQYTNWGPITKKHEDFKRAFVQAPIHIIACMRSKQDYILQERNGKQVPVKVGMAPVQRDGFEYECSVVFDIQMDHCAQATKDRSGLFDGEYFQITEDTGLLLREWLQKGGEPKPEAGEEDNDDEVSHV